MKKRSYLPPHLRTAPAKVDAPLQVQMIDTSVKSFPELGGNHIVIAKTVQETSLASRAKAWNEASRVPTAERERALQLQSLEEGKIALRALYALRKPPTPYVRQDEREQDRLDELEYYEALDEEAEWECDEKTEEEVDQWTQVRRRVARERVFREAAPTSDVSEADIRARMDFLYKQMRRSGVLREDKIAHEKEMRELEKKLYSCSGENTGMPKNTKEWE
jgi:hypothetical protein